MNLLPQDVLVMIKLCLVGQDSWTYEFLAHELGMSSSMLHSAVKRATKSRLFDEIDRRPRRKALEEFLIHGVKYAYPPDIGTITRGVPTAHAALEGYISSGEGSQYVWAHPLGTIRGMAVSPLYKSVPEIAVQDRRLHLALGAVDMLRIGRARERRLGEETIRQALHESAG